MQPEHLLGTPYFLQKDIRFVRLQISDDSLILGRTFDRFRIGQLILEFHVTMMPSFYQIFINLFLFVPIHYSTSPLKKHNGAPKQDGSTSFHLLQSTSSNYIKSCPFLNIKISSFLSSEESDLRITPLALNNFCQMIHFISFWNNVMRVCTMYIQGALSFFYSVLVRKMLVNWCSVYVFR